MEFIRQHHITGILIEEGPGNRVLAEGRIAAIAVDPKACALGQAATSILAAHAVGRSLDEIVAARDALKAMMQHMLAELAELEPAAVAVVERVQALPADGNKYELVWGELLVSPAPRLVHQRVTFRLARWIADYCDAHQLGEALPRTQ